MDLIKKLIINYYDMLKKKLIIFKIFINYFINKIKISEKIIKKLAEITIKIKKILYFIKWLVNQIIIKIKKLKIIEYF